MNKKDLFEMNLLSLPYGMAFCRTLQSIDTVIGNRYAYKSPKNIEKLFLEQFFSKLNLWTKPLRESCEENLRP